jgi:hypothetical protein
MVGVLGLDGGGGGESAVAEPHQPWGLGLVVGGWRKQLLPGVCHASAWSRVGNPSARAEKKLPAYNLRGLCLSRGRAARKNLTVRVKLEFNHELNYF